jgi:adenine-specific DNA-methyltransferase
MLDRIEASLGRPYYSTEGCAIYNVDCLDALSRIREEIVNLTVTSPPYNIGKEYDENRTVVDYVNWCSRWIHEIHRTTAANGAFWLNLGYLELPGRAKAIPIPYLLWDLVPFYLIQEVVWNYGAGVAARRFLSPRNEKFLWYIKNLEDYTFNLDDIRDPNVKYPNQKKNGKPKVNPLGKNPSDVWQFPKVTSGASRSSKERTPHPAQFPAAVIERLIKGSSNPGELVLDPFLGSGTTAVVALDLERPVVGFEIREDYCEIAARRVEKFLAAKQNAGAQASLSLSL